MEIFDKYEDLIKGPHIAVLATVNSACIPQATPIWFNYDKDRRLFYINTAKGRIKAQNMLVGAKVAMCILDKNNMYRYVAFQGEVIEVSEEGAVEHIQELARKYQGKNATFSIAPGEIRLKITIKPKYVHGKG